MVTATESALLRALQAHALQISESNNLDWGIAYSNPRFERVADANQIREVAIDSPDSLPNVFAAVDAHYAALGACCLRWSLAADRPDDELQQLVLGGRFTRADYTAMGVREWVELPTADNVRILPARAMRKAFHQILHDVHANAGDSTDIDQHIDASIERLNDPRTDGVVALVDGAPAGYCALFEIGDIGLVTGLFVLEPYRRKRVATSLLGHVLRLARRLLLRVTCTRVAESNSAGLALLNQCGFQSDGRVSEFNLQNDSTSPPSDGT